MFNYAEYISKIEPYAALAAIIFLLTNSVCSDIAFKISAIKLKLMIDLV
ncbi:hypothetical protein C3B55_00247 [Candidatus Pseudomonas adelgestsugas]|uniref:Uncharacterized protein n=1 Tax=Candidatus Pseudomonas adelgestsugas TaxID=1302376 RepID=A0ABX5R7R9_9PSED|nr:hypothetical protein C3B55_00247 [Candidatus Pseudomonas adelgestsugas]